MPCHFAQQKVSLRKRFHNHSDMCAQGFFGMNFFTLDVDRDGNNKWMFSQWFYVFFACTVPLTVLCLLIFAMNLPIISTILQWGKSFKAWRQTRKNSKRNPACCYFRKQKRLPRSESLTSNAGRGGARAGSTEERAKTSQSSDVESGTRHIGQGV
jgi:hypothetical protein